jgi:mannose-6-phosphate isomerase-like protein (cupin superfamily)
LAEVRKRRQRRISMAVTTQPYALAREEGEELWFLGAPTRVIANAEQTGGAFGLIEQVIPAGSESPLHVHHAEDESFYVVEGRMTFLCGDQKVHAEAGTFVYGPRGIPHGFRVEGEQPARVLLQCTPGGFEHFVMEMSEPAPPSGPPDMQRLISVAAKYGNEIVGPLPER